MGNKYYGLSEPPTSNREEKFPEWMEQALINMGKMEKKENPYKDCKNFYMKEYEDK